MVFCQYHAQNVKIWRRNVECPNFSCTTRDAPLLGNYKQNQCYNELLYAYQSAMTCRTDHNHTDKYQVSLCLETQTTLISALFHFEFER